MKCRYQKDVDCRYTNASGVVCTECELFDKDARPSGCLRSTLIILVILISLYVSIL